VDPAGGAFAIVQARPVTGLRDPWNDSLAVDHLWTNTNLGEAFPDVLTPATWSVAQLFMSRAMPTLSLDGHRGYGRIGGRFYLDLSVAAALSRVVGVSEPRFRRLIENTFGRLPDGVSIPPVALSRLRMLRLMAPSIVRFLGRVAANLRRLPRFVAENPARCAELRARVEAVDDPAVLAALWDDEVRPLVELGADMLGAAGRADPVALLTAQKRLRKLVGDADAAALTSGLTVDGDVLASLGPVVGLARLERGEIDAAAYAERYGHRSPHEFEVSLPRPVERPGWIDEQVAAMRAAGTDPLAMLERVEAANRAAWDRLVAAHPRRVRSARRRLDRWARVERGREQARTESVRTFTVVRALFLRAGELTGLADEVFTLTVEELVDVLRGGPPPDTAERRAAFERYAALPPYPMLIRGRFDPFAWAADPDRRGDLFDEGAAPAPADATISGFPGASGVVEGTVRVLRSVDDGAELRGGEVLVTTVTNVGWTPLFPRAAAVVTDVGAPLSHAAIVARELGIPAVVGCGNATTVLRTGDRVRVDGTRGTVTRT
jgi:pyruvate,water dikinase